MTSHLIMRYIKNNMTISDKLIIVFVLCCWFMMWIICATPKTKYDQLLEDYEQMKYLKDNK